MEFIKNTLFLKMRINELKYDLLSIINILLENQVFTKQILTFLMMCRTYISDLEIEIDKSYNDIKFELSNNDHNDTNKKEVISNILTELKKNIHDNL